MKLINTAIDDVKIIEPKVFRDERGFFLESFNQRVFEQLLGRSATFVQDNHSKSEHGVLRGIHYQIRQPQGKLVRVIHGEVYDVAVDLRKSSPTYGRWVGEYLSADNHKQLWVPEGFGHGFLVLSDSAELTYKTTDYYAPEHERSVVWNDSALNIRWPLESLSNGKAAPTLSLKDEQAGMFMNAEYFA